MAKEATYGVAPAAATACFEIASIELTPVTGVIEDANMNPTTISRRNLTPIGGLVRGRLRARVGYEGYLELLRGVLSNYVAITVETGVRDHIFKGAVDALSYTIDCDEGKALTATKTQRITGVVFTDLSLTAQAGGGEGGYLMAEASFLGKANGKLFDVTPMTGGVYASEYPIPFTQVALTGGDYWDGSDQADPSTSRPRNFEMHITQPYQEDRYFMSSKYPDRPLRNGPLECNFRIMREFDSKDGAVLSQSATIPDNGLLFQFNHPLIIGVGSTREFEIHAKSIVLGDVTEPVEGYQSMIQTIPSRAFYNASDNCSVLIRVRSGEAALV